jgi:hypothetical protein
MEDEDYKIYCLFNSKSNQFTCFVTSIDQFPEQIRKNLLIKEYKLKDLGIPDNMINLARFKWIGDYETGRLVDIVTEKKAIVTEKEINEKLNQKFWTTYEFYDVIHELIMNIKMTTDKGIEIQNFLSKLLTKRTDDINFYKNSDLHIWESISETIKREKDSFK